MKTLAALILCVLILRPAHAGSPPLGPEVAIVEIKFPRQKQTRRVVIGLHDEAAPHTVENFKALVQKKFYHGLRFHRVFPDTLVQTGDPQSRHGQSDQSGTGGPGWTLPCEIRLPHDKGAVAMARLPDRINPARHSNGSQFYVSLVPAPKLNGAYTVFGTILEGLDVLEDISKAPTNSNDFPLPKITIKSIVLAPRDSTASTTTR